MKIRCKHLLIALVLALWGTASPAATTITTFSVSATVVGSFSVSTSAPGSGTVDPVSLASTAVDAATTIDVSCANGTSDVGLDADTVTGTGDGTAPSLTVYGRIPSGQGAVPTGAYSDTITVTD